MKLIAVSGGIASGKSTIARRLAELGAHHIDADQLARQAVEPGSDGLSMIREKFGEGVVAADGSLNRAQLGQVVFGDAAALESLNAIVHPEVRRLAAAELAQIAASDPEAIVVYDVPLLVEAGVEMPWDLVVIAEAPAAERIRRMVELRGMTAHEAHKRLANQTDDEKRRAIADLVIDTGGSIEQTIAQTEDLWRVISTPG
jgi:dephospho-CoA kinase